MQTIEREGRKTWDTDALLELPEMRAKLQQLRETMQAMRAEMWITMIDAPENEYPDVEEVDRKYRPELKRLISEVREIAKANR